MASEASLGRYVLGRFALALPAALILLTLVFVLVRVVPGDPIQAALGGHVSQQEIEQRRDAAGYSRPLTAQYVDYLLDTVRLDLGTTITDRRSVASVVADNGMATVELALSAFAIALAIGLGLGSLAARRRDSWVDTACRLFGIAAYAAPVFFTGFLLQLVLGGWLGWLPTSRRISVTTELDLATHTKLYVVDAALARDWSALVEVLSHLAMPALALGVLVSGVLIRLVRANLLQTLRADHIEAARARGLSDRRVRRHALHNAAVPVVAVAGLQFALLLGGAVLTEQTFDWPGVGSELVRYLDERDYTAVQGLVTVFALVVVILSVLIDLLSAALDPRVRYR